MVHRPPRQLTLLLPYTSLMGAQNTGEMPIVNMYMALARLMIVPVVPYSAATSGVAASTDVLEMGDRNEQKDSSTTMMALRWRGNRS